MGHPLRYFILRTTVRVVGSKKKQPAIQFIQPRIISHSNSEILFIFEEKACMLLLLVVPDRFPPPNVINCACSDSILFIFFITFFILCLSYSSCLHHPWNSLLPPGNPCVSLFDLSCHIYHIVLLFDGFFIYFSKHFMGTKP